MAKKSTKGNRPVALVTGASSGIGECLAEDLASRGYDLILVARREEKLKELAARLKSERGSHCHVIAADLGEAKAAYELEAKVAALGLSVDFLVNNAGVMEFADFHELDPDKMEALIQLNVRGIATMCRAFVPGMVARKSGRVMNISSISAFWPIPKIAVYAASKAFVLHLTEALSEEYAGTGVSFTAICPSMTETPMVAGVRDNNEGVTLPKMFIGKADSVAKEAIDTCLNGGVVLVPGLPNRLAVQLSKLQPRWLLRKAIGLSTKAML